LHAKSEITADINIVPMTAADHADAFALWTALAGIGVHENDVDPVAGVGAFLEHNPGLSFVARLENRLVGTVLCGCDGRRGYLHHLAVAVDVRDRGIGRQLVAQAMTALVGIGIRKCHAFVFADNEEGLAFWESVGWSARQDLVVVSAATACS